MGKKVLILVGKIGEKKELFAQAIAKALDKDDKLVLARFSDLIFNVNGRTVDVSIEEVQEKITDFDFVYFRRAGTKFPSSAGTLAVCLDHFGIEYIDKTYRSLGPLGDKFTSLIRLAIAGLPVIPTFYCWHAHINDKKAEIIAKFGLPLVAKQIGSQKGRGVLLLKEEKDFAKLGMEFPEEAFLFQKYLPSDEEYRVLVLEEGIGAFERKIRTNPEEFRSNVALGAREEFIDIGKIPPKMKKIAIDACRTLEIQIGGVDILVDRKGTPWLLEVNRGPGLTYDPKVSPELANLGKYFAHKLKEK